VLIHYSKTLLKQLLWRGRRRTLKSLLLLFALGFGLSLVISACSPNVAQNQSTSEPLVLRIGHQKFDPLTLVKAKGNLEEKLKPLGVSSVEWTEFQAGPPIMEALNAGSIDLARTGDAPPVIAQAANAPLVYVGGSAPKNKSSAVLVKEDSLIKTIADLKGKKVAFAKSSSANYFIVRALKSGGVMLFAKRRGL